MNLKDLYQQAAEVLTGRRVIVQYLDEIPGRLGQVYKSNGTFIIQIIAGGSYAGVLPILLHEAAHVRLLADHFTDRGPINKADQSGNKNKNSGGDDQEQEFLADKLAACWLLFADQHAWRFEGSKTEQRLKALINKDLITERARQRG